MSATREILDAAAEYFQRNRGLFPKAIVPLLRDNFGLTPIEVIDVIRSVDKKEVATDERTS